MNIIETEGLIIKSWAPDAEAGALTQAQALAKLSVARDWIALMPDCHQGYGMPIGGVMATENAIVPNAVGVDIGCGMIAVQTNLTHIPTDTLKIIMGKVRERIPLGFNHQKHPQTWAGFDTAPDLPIIQQELQSARKQLGTLGGGNHFIEIQRGSDDRIWLMIHSGSRNIGLKVAGTYHKLAQQACAEVDIPNKDLAFLRMESGDGQDYYTAMNFCLDFAQANRDLMMRNLIDVIMEMQAIDFPIRVNIHHNYATWEHHNGRDVLVHRKGATNAALGLAGIIPGSMGTASYITEGLGNPESYQSCSHGAGRRMGRKEAKRTLVLEDEQAKMDGVVHGLRAECDLDEAPGAYKDIDTVMANQTDLVKINVSLRPLASIKG